MQGFDLCQLLHEVVDFQCLTASRDVAEYDSEVRQKFANNFEFQVDLMGKVQCKLKSVANFAAGNLSVPRFR